MHCGMPFEWNWSRRDRINWKIHHCKNIKKIRRVSIQPQNKKLKTAAEVKKHYARKIKKITIETEQQLARKDRKLEKQSGIIRKMKKEETKKDEVTRAALKENQELRKDLLICEEIIHRQAVRLEPVKKGEPAAGDIRISPSRLLDDGSKTPKAKNFIIANPFNRCIKMTHPYGKIGQYQLVPANCQHFVYRMDRQTMKEAAKGGQLKFVG